MAVAGSPQLTTAFVTCLLQSVSMSDVEAIKAMVAGGIDLNTTDGGRQGNSALHWAASFATAEVVKLLCSNGEDVNMQNTDGATPLHDAASRGDLGVLTAFIECGADATIKGAARSVKDKLPLDVVTDKGPNITEETAAAARVVLMKAQLAQPVGPASAAVDANSAGAGVGAGAGDGATNTSSGGLDGDGQVRFSSAVPLSGTAAAGGGSDAGHSGGGNLPDDYLDFRIRKPVPLHSGLNKLWPPPKKIIQTSKRLVLLPGKPSVMFKGVVGTTGNATGNTRVEADCIYDYLASQLQEVGLQPGRTAHYRGAAAHIELTVNPDLFAKPGAYRLSVEPTGVGVVAGSAAGLWSGVVTLIQMLKICNETEVAAAVGVQKRLQLPTVRISDWPDLKIRGYMLDISRNKVPTLAAAKELVDLLASLKFNQLQLYTEHTFAYQHHQEVWEDSDPFTGADILELDAYCRAKFVALVPNQQSCGHLHKFLVHKRYEGLAECPEGVDFGPRPSGYGKKTYPTGIFP